MSTRDTRSRQRAHVLRAYASKWAEPIDRWTIDCPYDGRGDERPCLVVEEAPECDFWRWEAGDHRAGCDRNGCGETDIGDGRGGELIAQECWDGHEWPDECNGIDHAYIGHSHPTEGCGAQTALDNLGWDGLRWPEDAEPFQLELPQAVSVHWHDEWTLEIRPMSAIWLPLSSEVIPATDEGAK